MQICHEESLKLKKKISRHKVQPDPRKLCTLTEIQPPIIKKNDNHFSYYDLPRKVCELKSSHYQNVSGYGTRYTKAYMTGQNNQQKE